MLNLHRYKISFTVLLIVLAVSLNAQLNLPEHDDQLMYFGISLGMNSSDYRVAFSEEFQNNDSILQVNPSRGPGFNLGIVTNFKLGKRTSIRSIPSLVFAEKRLNYVFFDGSEQIRVVENIYGELPIMLKYKTDRWENFRIYVLGGVQFDYDLASNARNRKQNDIIKARRSDVSIVTGGGLELFFSNFVFAPEFRVTHGQNNVLFREAQYNHSAVLHSLKSRSYNFVINLEGGGKLFKKKRRR